MGGQHAQLDDRPKRHHTAHRAGGLVLLEGFAVVSTVLNIVFLPLGTVYPNIASVTILILPVVIGLMSQRFERWQSF